MGYGVIGNTLGFGPRDVIALCRFEPCYPSEKVVSL